MCNWQKSHLNSWIMLTEIVHNALNSKYTILFFNVLFNITFGIIIKSGRESVMFFEEYWRKNVFMCTRFGDWVFFVMRKYYLNLSMQFNRRKESECKYFSVITHLYGYIVLYFPSIIWLLPGMKSLHIAFHPW